eukprot:5970791-Alexandrium_andersonii.AAC.1
MMQRQAARNCRKGALLCWGHWCWWTSPARRGGSQAARPWKAEHERHGCLRHGTDTKSVLRSTRAAAHLFS